MEIFAKKEYIEFSNNHLSVLPGLLKISFVHFTEDKNIIGWLNLTTLGYTNDNFFKKVKDQYLAG